MEDTIRIILQGTTLIVASLGFLAAITNWFKRTIPLQFGFLRDEKIIDTLNISTGDPAKQLFLRFHNSGKLTLTGIVLDIRFYRPTALSATEQALSFIPGKTVHGRVLDESYYLIRYSELDLPGEADVDFRVELNTQHKTPGTCKVSVIAYSTQQSYKYKKQDLSLVMN